MPCVIRWSIYLDDGSVFLSDDMTPENVPQDGIQVIVEWFDNGTVQIHEGSDYYWWTGDCWAYGGLNSLERWLRAMCPQVKFGRFTRNTVHNAAVAEASRWLSQ